MPSVAGLSPSQPGVDNPEYFQMYPSGEELNTNELNCIPSPVDSSSDLLLTSTDTAANINNDSGVLYNNNNESLNSVVHQYCNNGRATNENIDINNGYPLNSSSRSSSNLESEIRPPLPPRIQQQHPQVQHSQTLQESHFLHNNNLMDNSQKPVVKRTSAESPPKIPPRPRVIPPSPSYSSEYIYASPSKIQGLHHMSPNKASTPVSTSPAITAVHNALYHALDTTSPLGGRLVGLASTECQPSMTRSISSSSSTMICSEPRLPVTSSCAVPPTLPLKGLSPHPPAVGPKSPSSPSMYSPYTPQSGPCSPNFLSLSSPKFQSQYSQKFQYPCSSSTSYSPTCLLMKEFTGPPPLPPHKPSLHSPTQPTLPSPTQATVLSPTQSSNHSPVQPSVHITNQPTSHLFHNTDNKSNNDGMLFKYNVGENVNSTSFIGCENGDCNINDNNHANFAENSMSRNSQTLPRNHRSYGNNSVSVSNNVSNNKCSGAFFSNSSSASPSTVMSNSFHGTYQDDFHSNNNSHFSFDNVLTSPDCLRITNGSLNGDNSSPVTPEFLLSSNSGVGSYGEEVLRKDTYARCSLEDLRSSELRKQQAVNNRLAEEATHEAEKLRLDEIVQMCADYQRQHSSSRSVVPPTSHGSMTATTKYGPTSPKYGAASPGQGGTSFIYGGSCLGGGYGVTSPYGRGGSAMSPPMSPHSTLFTQNRIKTNGSLPRDKRSPPPTTCITSPGLRQHQQSGRGSPITGAVQVEQVKGSDVTHHREGVDHHHHHNLQADITLSPIYPRSSTYPPFPPFPVLPPLSSLLSAQHDTTFLSSSPPPCPRSPYENVLGQALSPAGSPFQSPDCSITCVTSYQCFNLSSPPAYLGPCSSQIACSGKVGAQYPSPCKLGTDLSLSPRQQKQQHLLSTQSPSSVIHDNLLSVSTALHKTSLSPSTTKQHDLLTLSQSVQCTDTNIASLNIRQGKIRSTTSPDAPPKPLRSPRVQGSFLGRRAPPPPPLPAVKPPTTPPTPPAVKPPTTPPTPPAVKPPSTPPTPPATNNISSTDHSFHAASSHMSGFIEKDLFLWDTNGMDVAMDVKHESTPVSAQRGPHPPVPPNKPCLSFSKNLVSSSQGNSVSGTAVSVHNSFGTKTSLRSDPRCDDSQFGWQHREEENKSLFEMEVPVDYSTKINNLSVENNVVVSQGPDYQNQLPILIDYHVTNYKKSYTQNQFSPDDNVTVKDLNNHFDGNGVTPKNVTSSEELSSYNNFSTCSSTVTSNVITSSFGSSSTSYRPSSGGSGGGGCNISCMKTSQDCNTSFGVLPTSTLDSLTSTSGATRCDSVSECEELLRAERNEALHYTTDLKRSVADLARQEEEAYRELEVERALLEAECSDVEAEVSRLEAGLLRLHSASNDMEARHQTDRERDVTTLEEGQRRVQSAEEALDAAEREGDHFSSSSTNTDADPDEETRLLEHIKMCHEQLDVERKGFEDTEFHQMEREAQREAEREDLNRLMTKERQRLSQQEERLAQLRRQVEALTAAVQRESSRMDAHRSHLNARLQQERTRAKIAEQKLLQLSGVTAAMRDSTSDGSSSNNTFASAHTAADSADGYRQDRAGWQHTYVNAHPRESTVSPPASPSASSDTEDDASDADSRHDAAPLGSRLHLLCDALSAMTQSATSLADNKTKDDTARTLATASTSVVTTTDIASEELRERRASMGEQRLLRREERDERTRTLDEETIARAKDDPRGSGGAQNTGLSVESQCEYDREGSRVAEYDHDRATHEYHYNREGAGDYDEERATEGTNFQVGDQERVLPRPECDMWRVREVLDPVAAVTDADFIFEDHLRPSRVDAAADDRSGDGSRESGRSTRRGVEEEEEEDVRGRYGGGAGGEEGDAGNYEFLSFPSVESQESSVVSVDFQRGDSTCSDDLLPRGMSVSANADTLAAVLLREREAGAEERRPLSEASSYCGGGTESVRLRNRGERAKQQRPLTRYLPVKSTEPSSLQFSLRHHIESAGHQIELCPSLLLTATTCRGYLHKMAGSVKNKMAGHHGGGATAGGGSHGTLKSSGRLFGMRGFNKRWFVFDRTERALTYYADKSEGKPRGCIYFEDIEEVYVDHLNPYTSSGSKKTSKNPASVAFCVKTRQRTLQLLATTPAAMRIWVEVVFTGAEAYSTYDEYSQLEMALT